MNKIKEVLKKNTMLIVLVIVMIMFNFLTLSAGKGSLFKPQNISNIIAQNSYVVILATGMLLCILTGGNIDLSIGAVVALVGAVAGTLVVTMKVSVLPTIIICLLVGTLVGSIQAFWIAYVKIPPFIVTLAGMLLWRGVAYLILQGLTISPYPDNYLKFFTSFLPGGTSDKQFIFGLTLGIGAIICLIFIASEVIGYLQKKRKGYETDGLGILIAKLVIISGAIIYMSYLLGQYKGVPVVLILIAVVVLAYGYFTSRTVPGRYLYALGGNEKAAKLSGVNTDAMKFFAYANMGFLSAVAALVCVARFNSSMPSLGTSFELDAIGACFIGGASAYGGIGTVGGAVIGAIFMGVLNNGMSILGVDSNWQFVVKGAVLLAAVAFDIISKNKSRA